MCYDAGSVEQVGDKERHTARFKAPYESLVEYTAEETIEMWTT